MIEGDRDAVEVVVEQFCVAVEGHGRGSVPEHALQGLHVRAGLHGERCRRVPQVVRCELGREIGVGGLAAFDGAHEPAVRRGRRFDEVDAVAEHERVTAFALALTGELVGEERGERHLQWVESTF